MNVGEIDLNSTALAVGADRIDRSRKGDGRVFKRRRRDVVYQLVGEINPDKGGSNDIIIEKQ